MKTAIENLLDYLTRYASTTNEISIDLLIQRAKDFKQWEDRARVLAFDFDDCSKPNHCIVGYWVPFDWSKKETHPPAEGVRYLICKKDGKIHWENWTLGGWSYNHNEIRYYAQILPPKPKPLSGYRLEQTRFPLGKKGEKGKAYISGKITGIENEAPALFAAAEKELNERGYNVVNPLTLNHAHDKSWHSYMKEDIKALCDCDMIHMLANWTDSKGAIIEHTIAMYLGLKVEYANTTQSRCRKKLNRKHIAPLALKWKSAFRASSIGENVYHKRL